LKIKTVTVLVLAVALVITMCLPTAIAISENDRHTPGFPQITKNLQSLFQPPINISNVEKVLRELLKKGVLSRDEAEKLENLSNMSFKDAITRIENSELRNNLLNLANKNSLTPEDIEAFMNYLSSLKASGLLSPVDELLALRALEALARAIQSPYTSEILLKMLLALKELEVARSGDITLSFKGLQQSSSKTSLASFQGAPLPSLQLPSIPQLRFSLPQVPFSTLIITALCCSIALMLLFSRRILSPLFKKMKAHFIGKMPVLEVSDRFLDAYWRSVYIVSAISGVRRADVETHREFLVRVSKMLNSRVAEVFRDITFAYEEYRYGFRAEAGQRILEGFRRLTSYARLSK
jgi:predicted transcriptional regulator